MRTIQYSYFIMFMLLIGCGSKQTQPAKAEEPVPIVVVENTTPIEETIEEKEDFTALVFNVKLGVSALRPNWVLYQNGCYMLFKDPLDDATLSKAANDRILVLDSSVALSVKKSNLAKGWVVTFGNSGIYCYVSPDDLAEGIPTNQAIENQARNNIKQDQKALRIIHINKKN